MIDIIVSNGIPYVWNADDWKTLRTEYRIIGKFDGATQNTSLSYHSNHTLPLRLSKIETQLLLKLGVARTIEIPKLCTHQRLAPVEEYMKRRTEHRLEQVALMKERKRLELEALVDKIIEGKRKKGRTLIPDRNAIINDELGKISLESLRFETVKVDLKDPWIKTSDCIPYEFPKPVSELDLLKFRVFEDFNCNHKYFLTSGTLFGGDFIAYPGDPVEYHGEFVIICQGSNQKLSDLSLISELRLATTVRKTLLLASFRDGELHYKRIIGPHNI